MTAIQDQLDRALWALMEFDANRYLIANTAGRQDGAEKAQRHMNLCHTYLKVMHGLEYKHSLMMFIHDYSQSLTSYLDEKIGFPVYDKHPDYSTLSRLFVAKFVEVCGAAYEAATDENAPKMSNKPADDPTAFTHLRDARGYKIPAKISSGPDEDGDCSWSINESHWLEHNEENPCGGAYWFRADGSCHSYPYIHLIRKVKEAQA